jgi:ABC-type nitrate/sulfonate/bicarbonate transport system permease component
MRIFYIIIMPLEVNRVEGVTQVAEHLHSMRKTLGSSPSTAKKKKEEHFR